MFFCCLFPADVHKEYCFSKNRISLFECNFYSLKFTIEIYNIKKISISLLISSFCKNPACDRCYLYVNASIFSSVYLLPLNTGVQPDSIVAISADGSEQQVAISVSWRNGETLTGFWEVIGHQSLLRAKVLLSWAVRCLGPLKANGPGYTRGLKTTDRQGFGLFQVIQDRLVMSGKPIRDDLVQEWDHQLHKRAWLT